MATEKTATKTKTKNDRIYVRLNSDLKREFEAIAVFRGLNPSAMLHSFVVQTIHKVRSENPEIFVDLLEDPLPVKSETKSLSGQLVAKSKKKTKKKENTFTTGDGKTIPLVEEGEDEK